MVVLIIDCYIGLFGIYFMQVLYLGRAPRTKETLPDFREKCRVARHSRVFRGLTGSQRTPGFWGVTCVFDCATIACALRWGVAFIGDYHYWALLTRSWDHISGAGQLLVDGAP